MISVVIPTYNRAGFIAQAIESVLAQSEKVDEIIVVDDGSTDNTQEVVQNFHEVRYLLQKNGGVSSARNSGIKAARGEWIAFLDSDDVWEKGKIAQQKSFHEENPQLLISHTDEEWIRENKKINKPQKFKKFGGDVFERSLDYTTIGTSTLMVHKKVFEDVGVYDESLPACEDFDLFLRIGQKYPFGYIDKKLTLKRAGHGGQLSFDTPFLDLYRVQSLMKFREDEKVKEVIDKKVEILRNGAIKHNNSELIAKLDTILKI